MTFDPEEFVTLYCVGRMTLRAAVERVMAQELQDLDAAIFRYGEPSILTAQQLRRSLRSGNSLLDPTTFEPFVLSCS